MSHIHTEPGQYDVTVGAYVFRLDTPEPTIVLPTWQRVNADQYARSEPVATSS